MITDGVSSWIRLILYSTMILLELFHMIFLDFACGFTFTFCKRPMALLQWILALSIPKFEVQMFKALYAAYEVRDSSTFITLHTEKEP